MSCLFNALGAHTGEQGEVVRQKLVQFMRSNPTLGGDMKTHDVIRWESQQDPTTYFARMQSSSTWGGAVEISAFVQLYNLNVCVHNIRDHNTKLIRFVKPGAQRCVAITWNGGHYEPIIITTPTA